MIQELKAGMKRKVIEVYSYQSNVSLGEVVTVREIDGSCFYTLEEPSKYLGENQTAEFVEHSEIAKSRGRTEDTISRFAFHKPDATGIEAMTAIRKEIRKLALLIENSCPESREKATALTQLSFVMMSANSAIVQQYPIDENDLDESEKGIIDES